MVHEVDLEAGEEILNSQVKKRVRSSGAEVRRTDEDYC